MAEGSKNGRSFAIAMFLAGALLAGMGGVLRGDWIGREAATEVKLELKEDTIQMEGRIEKRLDKIERKLDRVLNLTR